MEKISSLLTTTTGSLSKTAKVINPYSGETITEQQFVTDDELNKRIDDSYLSFQKFRKTDPHDRAQKILKLGEILRRDKEKFARTITMEMGKPLRESREEIEWAALECDYYGKNVDEFIKRHDIKGSQASQSYVVYQPLGPIYHVTSYTFPIVFLVRAAISSLIMGNTVINKSSKHTPQSGMNAEQAFKEAGFNTGEFTNLIISRAQSELIIKHNNIRGVSYSGSTEWGRKIGELVGRYGKKSVMILGGNDPFIVLKDADLNLAVDQAIKGRLMNGGQRRTASKRFLIDDSVYEEFKGRLLEKLKTIKMGDPMDENTVLGPLAKKSGVERIMEQVERGTKKGAKLLYGGKVPEDEKLKKAFFYMPTVLELDEKNPLFNEETFGPVFLMMRFKNEQDAIRIANNSCFGLGGSIFSKDVKRAQDLALEVDSGMLYINSFVRWDVTMSGGGVKDSGYGREGGLLGTWQFVNKKTVWIA